MLPPPLFNRNAVDSSIKTFCNRTAYWIFHDAMPTIVDAPLTLIFQDVATTESFAFFAIKPTYTYALDGWDNAAH